MSDCLFCKIISGDIPSKKVYEDELCYAFYDIDPQAPTHFLVIPKQHIRSAAEVDDSNSAVVAHCFRKSREGTGHGKLPHRIQYRRTGRAKRVPPALPCAFRPRYDLAAGLIQQLQRSGTTVPLLF